jgi:hypothetical protein
VTHDCGDSGAVGEKRILGCASDGRRGDSTCGKGWRAEARRYKDRYEPGGTGGARGIFGGQQFLEVKFKGTHASEKRSMRRPPVFTRA